MDYLSIKNWKKYQHYHDRKPPWVKLYIDLLDPYDSEGKANKWRLLAESPRLLLVCMWMLAGRHNNKIPHDERYIELATGCKCGKNIEILVSQGFVIMGQDASDVLAEPMQDASDVLALTRSRETETETETETDIRRVELDIFDREKSFTQFWDAYPKCKRKACREKCRERYRANIKTLEDHERLLQALGIDYDALEWSAKPEYIPAPLVWLNRKRWLDDLGDFEDATDHKPEQSEELKAYLAAKKQREANLAKTGIVDELPF
jgi:hypothetical protein